MPVNPMMALLLGFGVLMLLVSLWLLRKSMMGNGTGPRPVDGGAEADATNEAPNGNTALRQEAEQHSLKELMALHRSREMIQGLLAGVSENVRNLLDDMEAYTDSLERHETAVRKAQTLAALEEVERLLLSDISEMRSSSNAYRSQLDEANQTISLQRAELDRLSQEASLDFLTRVFNRRALDRRILEELNRSAREKSVFSLVLFDIDRFKAINDTYGHLCGDEVLRQVAASFGEHCREYDFLARYGGEEFALLLPGTSLDEAGGVADKLRSLLAAEPMRALHVEIPVTVSAGVAEVMLSGDTVASLVSRADRGLYQAKNTGRNRVVLQNS